MKVSLSACQSESSGGLITAFLFWIMQLACQLNSLNLRSFTVQEIAELSEILTVQKNARH